MTWKNPRSNLHTLWQSKTFWHKISIARYSTYKHCVQRSYWPSMILLELPALCYNWWLDPWIHYVYVCFYIVFSCNVWQNKICYQCWIIISTQMFLFNKYVHIVSTSSWNKNKWMSQKSLNVLSFDFSAGLELWTGC